jgi:hypothetical protein
MIRTRRLRWAWHAACMGEIKISYQILVRKPEGNNHLEDPDLDGRTILKWILKK